MTSFPKHSAFKQAELDEQARERQRMQEFWTDTDLKDMSDPHSQESGKGLAIPGEYGNRHQAAVKTTSVEASELEDWHRELDRLYQAVEGVSNYRLGADAPDLEQDLEELRDRVYNYLR